MKPMFVHFNININSLNISALGAKNSIISDHRSKLGWYIYYFPSVNEAVSYFQVSIYSNLHSVNKSTNYIWIVDLTVQYGL